MRSERIAIGGAASGCDLSLTVQRFGADGARPRVVVQASLHADEIPGMITAVELRKRLLELEAEGAIIGEIVLVPVANPIGLGQMTLGALIGRFDLRDGGNFNRAFPWLAPGAAKRLDGQLGPDAEANRDAVRAALLAELDATPALTSAECLKSELLRLSLPADLVLDLHCDSEATTHLYTMPQTADVFASLAARLEAQAVLVAEESGADPFDEAVSRPWFDLAARFPDHPIPQGCASVTVELRGEADVEQSLAESDADVIVAFLADRSVIALNPPPVPQPQCEVTPLASVEHIISPVSGIVVFRMKIGAHIIAGDVIAEIVEPLSGDRTLLTAQSDGILFARASIRYATPGRRLAKIAGVTLKRTGKLLTP